MITKENSRQYQLKGAETKRKQTEEALQTLKYLNNLAKENIKPSNECLSDVFTKLVNYFVKKKKLTFLDYNCINLFVRYLNKNYLRKIENCNNLINISAKRKAIKEENVLEVDNIKY